MVSGPLAYLASPSCGPKFVKLFRHRAHRSPVGEHPSETAGDLRVADRLLDDPECSLFVARDQDPPQVHAEHAPALEIGRQIIRAGDLIDHAGRRSCANQPERTIVTRLESPEPETRWRRD